jgi:hypothetical protein
LQFIISQFSNFATLQIQAHDKTKTRIEENRSHISPFPAWVFYIEEGTEEREEEERVEEKHKEVGLFCH